jgi:hypothetical protein
VLPQPALSPSVGFRRRHSGLAARGWLAGAAGHSLIGRICNQKRREFFDGILVDLIGGTMIQSWSVAACCFISISPSEVTEMQPGYPNRLAAETASHSA